LLTRRVNRQRPHFPRHALRFPLKSSYRQPLNRRI